MPYFYKVFSTILTMIASKKKAPAKKKVIIESAFSTPRSFKSVNDLLPIPPIMDDEAPSDLPPCSNDRIIMMIATIKKIISNATTVSPPYLVYAVF